MNRAPSSAFTEQRQRAHAALRAGQAASAEAWLRALEAQQPGEVNCLWLLGVALLYQDKVAEGIATLERALAAAPDFANARVDLARAYRRAGRTAEARQEVRRVLEQLPQHHRAWLAYGDVLVDLRQYADANVAFERARLTDPHREQIDAATAAFVAEDNEQAEAICRDILRDDASHIAALCGLAAVSLAVHRAGDAERLLRHALKQSEHVPLAHRALGPVLVALGRLAEADRVTQYLAQIEPQSPQTWVTIASVATKMLRQELALEAYQRAATMQPREVGLRISIGHVQKTLGHRSNSEASYKAALQLDPGRGDAYWSLADLKNYSFSDAEVAAMQRLVAEEPRDNSNEAQLHFALGRAFEQRGQYEQAFDQYARGNALRRRDAPFNATDFEERSERVRRFFDAAYFAAHRAAGASSNAPIFIVGLPRSGSTLVEQILASHPQVEGTMELPNILHMVGEFDDRAARRDGYPETLAGVSDADLSALGARYLDETAMLRSDRARFTDKLPNNFSHLGLIHAILPRATLIDVRRHPMDSCFSTFKQHFAEGQTFSYDLTDLGRYYRCYLAMMDHWDRVLPGKVLCLSYEALVREPETNVRALLQHCGLPYEPACLEFHKTQRSVRTASAEQVRQPLYASGVGYWRHFEAQLEPLRQALGDALTRFK